MENMNLFDMLGDFGIKTPVVEKRKIRLRKRLRKRLLRILLRTVLNYLVLFC